MAEQLSFGVLYRAASLAFLQAAKREYLPDHTETDPYDVVNAVMSIQAAAMHRNACLIDRTGEENFWPTYRTRAGAISMGRLVGYRLSRETPAAVDVVGFLTRLFTVAETLAVEGTRFSTLGDSQVPSVGFELEDDYTIKRTAFDGDLNTDLDGGEVFMWNQTTEAWADWNPSQNSDVYPSESLGDAVYFGHSDLMFTSVTLNLSSVASVNGVWEYYDERFVFNPGPDDISPNAAVQDLGGGVLRMRVDAYSSKYGTQDISDGTFQMEVICISTGVTELCTVQWQAAPARNYVETTTYLGQVSPSTTASDYEIRPFWVMPSNRSDGTQSSSSGITPFQESGEGVVTWDLPQTDDSLDERARRWTKTTLNTVEAFWVRVRRCGTAGAGSATLTACSGPTPANWWGLFEVVQGKSTVEVIGQASGDKLQRYQLASDEYVEASLEIRFDGDIWTEVSSLFRSDPDDRNFELQEEPDGTLYVQFGDGVNGKIPTGGGDIEALYRTGASVNGNIGAGAIVQSDNALLDLNGITNPRPASGWEISEGRDEVDLNRLRVWVPGWARVGEKVVTPEDAEYHAIQRFTTADDRKPIARADGAESATDAQVITLWVLGKGGVNVSSDDLEEAELYFNGRIVGLQRFGGVVLANQEVQLLNATKRVVNVTATVTVLSGNEGGVEELVRAELKDYLNPLSTDDSGVFRHRIGGKVSYARTGSIIDGAVETGLSDYTYEFTGEASPTSSIDLAAGELPSPGTISVNVVAVDSD